MTDLHKGSCGNSRLPSSPHFKMNGWADNTIISLRPTIKMPPRMQLLSRAARATCQSSYQPIAPFLYPFLGQQRSASILGSLNDTSGSYNKRIRRGRGPASGKGKTSGRGHKGQKQHGKVPVGFNGGQTPDEVVAGSRGAENMSVYH